MTKRLHILCAAILWINVVYADDGGLRFAERFKENSATVLTQPHQDQNNRSHE